MDKNLRRRRFGTGGVESKFDGSWDMRPSDYHLTIFDALVLIAATAIGLVGSVCVWNGPFYSGMSYLEFDLRFIKS
jgi:hypothetical protein